MLVRINLRPMANRILLPLITRDTRFRALVKRCSTLLPSLSTENARETLGSRSCWKDSANRKRWLIGKENNVNGSSWSASNWNVSGSSIIQFRVILDRFHCISPWPPRCPTPSTDQMVFSQTLAATLPMPLKDPCSPLGVPVGFMARRCNLVKALLVPICSIHPVALVSPCWDITTVLVLRFREMLPLLLRGSSRF